MLLPNCFADHLVLVTRDIGDRPFIDKIEHDRNVDLAFWLAQIMRDQPAYVLREGNTELSRSRVRSLLQFGINRDLCSRVHEQAIMPSISP